MKIYSSSLIAIILFAALVLGFLQDKHDKEMNQKERIEKIVDEHLEKKLKEKYDREYPDFENLT